VRVGRREGRRVRYGLVGDVLEEDTFPCWMRGVIILMFE
jgi:hypothetical protein